MSRQAHTNGSLRYSRFKRLTKRVDGNSTKPPHAEGNADGVKHAQPPHAHPDQHHSGKDSHGQPHVKHHGDTHKTTGGEGSPREPHKDHPQGEKKEPAKPIPSSPAPSGSVPATTALASPNNDPIYRSHTSSDSAVSQSMSKKHIGELSGGLAVFVLLLVLLGSYLYYRFVIKKKRGARLAIANRLSIKDRENEDMRGIGSIYGAPSSFGDTSRGTRSNTSVGTLMDPFSCQRERDRKCEPHSEVVKTATNIVKRAEAFDCQYYSSMSIRTTLSSSSPDDGKVVSPTSLKPSVGVTDPKTTSTKLTRCSASHDQAETSDFEINRCLSYYVKNTTSAVDVEEHNLVLRSSANTSLPLRDLPQEVDAEESKQRNLLERVRLQQLHQREEALAHAQEAGLVQPPLERCGVNRISQESVLSSASTLKAERAIRCSEHTIRAVSGGVFEYTRYQQDPGNTSTSSHFLSLPSAESEVGDCDDAKRLSRRSIYSQESGQGFSDASCSAEPPATDEIFFP